MGARERTCAATTAAPTADAAAPALTCTTSSTATGAVRIRRLRSRACPSPAPALPAHRPSAGAAPAPARPRWSFLCLPPLEFCEVNRMIRMISFTDFTAARTRRTCRVQYQDLLDALDDGDAALFTTEPPADRAAHLSAMADVVDAMSCLYASAHTGDPLAARTGGRWTMPLTLASGVTLYRLAAAAEQDLADAEWTDAADIHPYEWLWFA